MDTRTELGILCQAVLLGGGLGLIYDLMRVARRRVPLPGLGTVLDFSFWMLATAALFHFSHEAWAGQVRLYGAAFCLLGGTAYFWGVSPVFLAVALRLTDMLVLILGMLFLPARVLGKVLGRIGKNVKNLFSFKKKWSMINSKPKG